MQRIDGPFNVSTKPELSPPANSPGYFSGGDPLRGRKATRVTKDWLNRVQEEICNVIEAAGINLDRADDTQLLQALRVLFGLSPDPGSRTGAKPLEPGDFEIFLRQTPPDRWAVANGALLVGADAAAPALWGALQKPENAWRLKTQEEWNILSRAEPWNGIGGVPYFVLDVNAKTVRLPDLRGMYAETAGFDGLAVGGVHGDMIRNITGYCDWQSNTAFGGQEGALYPDRSTPDGVTPTIRANGSNGIRLDVGLVVPTGNANKPRAFGVLGCVYLGEAES